MANFHPTDNALAEFSAGSLDWALSIPVSAHIELCPECKQKIAEYNTVGGSVLQQVNPISIKENSFEQLMTRIKTEKLEPISPCDEVHNEHPLDERTRHLPKVIQKLVPTDKPLKWSSLSPKLKSVILTSGQKKYEVRFHKIKSGGEIAEHDHTGLEVTLVLEGSFSDANGNYAPGDYIEKKPGEVHKPIAAQNQDCLCLSILEGPVKFTGLIGKIVNPFLSISPQ